VIRSLLLPCPTCLGLRILRDIQLIIHLFLIFIVIDARRVFISLCHVGPGRHLY
jgi:hypothetical protein